MSSPADVYAFGSYRLDTASRILTRSDAVIALAPKTFDLLILLAGSGGRLMSRRELMDLLWRDTAVEEANLSFQISTLRKALGEEGTAWIEAVPKHGYRFNVPVEHFRATEKPELAGQTQLVELASDAGASQLRRRLLVATAIAGAAIVLAFAIWKAWPNDRQPVAAPMLTVFPATTFRGRETNPNFSPDGSQIAFAWDAGDGGDFDIYVKVVGENRAVRLTSDRRPEFSPVWSPDGRRIAFCRDGESGSEVVLISALGGPERILADFPKVADPQKAAGLLAWYRGIHYPNTHLAWFPDGRLLAAVARTRKDGPNTVVALSVDDREIRAISSPPDGGWGDDSPVVSLDGHRLAFVRSLTPYPSPSHVYVQRLSDSQTLSGDLQQVADGAVAGLAWTSDGQRLVFRSMGGLWTVGLDHRTPESITLRGYNPYFPAVSAKTDRLAFVDVSEDKDIWRVSGPAVQDNAARAPRTPIRLISSTRLDTNPQYSSDGKRVAFTSSRSGTFQIWTCDSDGSNPVQLTELSNAEAGTPRWSPDDRYIAFDVLRAGSRGVGDVGDVYVISANGGPIHLITPENSNEDMASWSHDGKWIYFESDRSGVFEIWKAPFAGGGAVQITDKGGASALESADGHYVYFSKWQRRGLWRTPVEGGGEETLVMNSGSPYLWSLYDKGVCAVDTEAGDT